MPRPHRKPPGSTVPRNEEENRQLSEHEILFLLYALDHAAVAPAEGPGVRVERLIVARDFAVFAEVPSRESPRLIQSLALGLFRTKVLVCDPTHRRPPELAGWIERVVIPTTERRRCGRLSVSIASHDADLLSRMRAMLEVQALAHGLVPTPERPATGR